MRWRAVERDRVVCKGVMEQRELRTYLSDSTIACHDALQLEVWSAYLLVATSRAVIGGLGALSMA